MISVLKTFIENENIQFKELTFSIWMQFPRR